MVLVKGGTEYVLGVEDLAWPEPAGGAVAGAVPYEGGCGGKGTDNTVPGRFGF